MHGEPAHVAIEVAEVERIAALGWRGLEEAHLGQWLLRAADGFTGRSNSALVLGEPPKSDTGWLLGLVGWYADRGLPPMVQISLPGGEAVDAVLAAAGWRTHDLVRFLTGDIDEVQTLAAAGLPDPSALTAVEARIDAVPDDSWLAAYHYRGAALPGHAREVLRRAGHDTQLSFASLSAPAGDDGSTSVLAVGRGALAQGWLGITAVTVPDQHRRQRHGTRLMWELAAWGAERGARAIYLQVASENAAALQWYAGLGFHHHHDYRYRVGPDPVDLAP